MRTDACFRINTPTVAHQHIDGEAVLIHFDSGCYYSTDKLGAEILALLDGSNDLAAVVDCVAKRRGLAGAAVHDTVVRFVNELFDEELIAAAPATQTGQRQASTAVEPGTTAGTASIERPVLEKYTDLQDLLLLDPIHDTDEAGWPALQPDRSEAAD